MTQLIPFSSQLSLISNGNFTQGLAGWFGSYIRHEPNTVVFPEEPQYLARFFTGATGDFVDTIPAGINQFIDVPELFTYPSRRNVDQLQLRIVSEDTGLLNVGPATAFADGTPVSLTNHPFRFEESATSFVEISSGTPMILTELTGLYSGEVRSGKLRAVKTADVVTSYVLPIRLGRTPTPILSSTQFDDVLLEQIGVNPTVGTGVLRFLADEATLNLIKDFDRGDGTTGFRPGDTILLTDRSSAVQINSPVPTVLNTTGGLLGYNLSFSSLPGIAPVTSGGDTEVWSVFPGLFTSASFSMNLYRFDYTLAYTYATTNARPPRPAQLNLYTVGEDIRGIGTLSNTVPSKPELTIDVEFESNTQWRRRLEYLAKEFVVPPKGRWMLNIPPAGFTEFILGDPLELESIAYNPSTNRVQLEYTEYGELGNSIVSMSYNVALGRLTIVGHPTQPFNATPGQLRYISGSIAVMPAWLREPIDERRGLFVVSYNAGTNTVILNLQVSLASGSTSLTNLFDTTLRLSETRSRQARLRYAPTASWEVRLQGTLPASAAWAAPLFDRNSSIHSLPTFVSEFGFASSRLRVEVDWPATALTTAQSLNTDTLGIVVGLSGETDSQAVIGDVSLWRGYQFYRMNSTDTADVWATSLGTNVSIDPLLSRTDSISSIVPKGTVVLYAGGGVCPTGYKPVTNMADAEPSSMGLPALPTVPWPDEVEYDEVTDTSKLIWNYQRFDQLNPDGSVILKDANVRYVQLTVPGVTLPGGTVYTRQLTIEQAKQYIEPGMVLRAKEQVYADDSSLITAISDLTEVDKYGPVADFDSSFLITDLDLTVGAELTSGASATPLLANIFPGFLPIRSTFGDGAGTVEYPSQTPAVFIPRPTGASFAHEIGTAYPLLPPAGPGREDQVQIFYPSTPYAYLVIDELLPGGGQIHQEITCHRMTTADEVITGAPNPFVINKTGYPGETVAVTVQTDAFPVLNELAGHHTNIVSGDVFFARVFLYQEDDPGTANPTVSPNLHDSFLVKVRETAAGWSVFRYDSRSFRLYNIGEDTYKETRRVDSELGAVGSPEGQGNYNIYMTRVRGGFIVLQPATLYGNPRTRQAYKPVLPPGDSIGVSPQGTGEGFIQQKVSVQGNPVTQWLTSIVQVGTTITVTGKMSDFTGDTSELLVEPSGYLRYDDPTTGIDYGASGHRHAVNANTDLVLDDAIPRVLNTRLGHYPALRLPSEHGHGQIGDIAYAMPTARLFTLCVKL